MKANIRIIIAVSLTLVLAGCRGSKNKPSGSTENMTVSGVEAARSIEDIYLSLQLIDLPLESARELLQKFQTFDPVGESDFHRLTDIGDMKSPYNGSARAVRLPENDGKKFILVGYFENGQWTIELYSLSVAQNPIDRLRLYSVEKLNGEKSVITQTFSIDRDYRSEVSKRLNDVLIERLTYIPMADGTFEELRDGKTTTVAYDSYDGVNYIVQTFIWHHNESGGLIRKDLRTENYRIDENGDLVIMSKGI